MITIKSDSENQRVFLKAKGSKAAFKNGIRRGFYSLGKELVKTAKQGILNPPKTGKVYSIGKEQYVISHQASAAGQYPANQRPAWRTALGLSKERTARLAFSLGFTVHGYYMMTFGSQVPHGKYMQEGTDPANGKGKIAPRPFLTLATKANEKNAIKIIEAEIAKGL